MTLLKPSIRWIVGATLVTGVTLLSNVAAAESRGLQANIASGIGIEDTVYQSSDRTVLTAAEKRRLLRQQKRKKRVRVTRQSHGGSFRR